MSISDTFANRPTTRTRWTPAKVVASGSARTALSSTSWTGGFACSARLTRGARMPKLTPRDLNPFDERDEFKPCFICGYKTSDVRNVRVRDDRSDQTTRLDLCTDCIPVIEDCGGTAND